MTGKIILFIVLLIIFYGFAAFIANSMAGSGGNQEMVPIIGLLVTAPGALAYYLAFVLIN